ncbi:MAG TPA: metallophosphoesterase [Candidatus Dormibacteraeota bacterium]|nr:metallophosphoesterase [Candidatus Dormibacteraeota bacterium]
MSPFGIKRGDTDRTRIFFATDVHGSERCFRKWVNAAAVYEADALILGGDVTGKSLIPIVESQGGWDCQVHGRRYHADDEGALEGIRSKIRAIGQYDVVLSPADRPLLEEPAELDSYFAKAMRDRLVSWVRLARERLGSGRVQVYMMLGNDDDPALADVLREADAVTYAEDAVVSLPGGYELVSVGYSTPTPWNTRRELSEEKLAAVIDAQAQKLSDQSRAIFNFHCPPVGTHLDLAPKLDETLRPVVDINGQVMIPVGSRSVRAAIETVQPLLGLHGHIHESAGVERIGRTVCINPGSDYHQGVLRGAIVDLHRDKGVRTWQLIQG